MVLIVGIVVLCPKTFAIGFYKDTIDDPYEQNQTCSYQIQQDIVRRTKRDFNRIKDIKVIGQGHLDYYSVDDGILTISLSGGELKKCYHDVEFNFGPGGRALYPVCYHYNVGAFAGDLYPIGSPDKDGNQDYEGTTSGMSYQYTIEIFYYDWSDITASSLSPADNQVVSNILPCFPQLNVNGGEAYNINCSYSIDGNAAVQTKNITNAFNNQTVQFDKLDISNLTNGAHTIKFTANDANNIDYSDEKTVNFVVDKTPPQISNIAVNSGENYITINGVASDANSGLVDQAYNFCLNDQVVGWWEYDYHTWNNLTPNTYYDVKMGARDKGLNEAWTNPQHICTEAQQPWISLKESGSNYMDLGITDSNPSNTQYLISVCSGNGSDKYSNIKYVDSNGNITSNQVWITVPSKDVKITNLTDNTDYTFYAKARNSENIETYQSNTIDHYTLANPTEITFTPSQTKMDLTWNAVSGATGYTIAIDGNAQPDVTSNYFTHSGLQPEEQHTYSVRVLNQSGYGPWSAPRAAKTLPYPPDNPPALNFKPTNKSMTISWGAVARATLYNLEIYDANGYKINSFSTSDLSYLQDNLHSVTTYSYRIQAQNAGGTSDWSPKYTETTYPDPPVAPVGLAGKESYKYIDLTWNKADRATSYIIEITNPDGTTKDVTLSGDNTSYRHDGLTEDNKYKYRIMASNIGGDSQWSDYIQITTLPIPPKTPTNVTALGETGAVTLTWDAMLYATSYDIEVDGDSANIIHNGNSTVYKQTNLQDNSKHQYRIMAINRGGQSDWTKSATVYTLPGAQASGEPQTSINAAAVATRNSVNIYWEPVSNNAEYEIEVDGQLHDNGKSTSFIHDGLEADTSHTYRIRVKNDSNGERWYAILTLSTLPNPPQAPGNLTAVPSYGSVALKWDAVDNVNGYDVEVDGKIISNDMNTTYLSDGLDAGTAHTYRVRARNLGGTTAWTPLITVNTLNPAYSINCIAGKTINFDMTVSQLQTFSGKTFCVEYNPDEIEVVDLCGLTQAPDVNLSATEPTAIPDANMYVMGSMSNGKKALQYTIYQPVTSGEVYSGIVNRIIFRAKKDCKTQIFYTIK